MFQRVLKSQTAQFLTSTTSSSSTTQSNNNQDNRGNTASSSSSRMPAAAAVPPSPSKIPLPATPRASKTTSSASDVAPPPHSKENRSHHHQPYVTTTQAHRSGTSTASTPVKGGSAASSAARHGHSSSSTTTTNSHHSQVPRAHDPPAPRSHVPDAGGDIHMMTVNPSAVNPALLRQLADGGNPPHGTYNVPATVGSTTAGVPVPPVAEQKVAVPHHFQQLQSAASTPIRSRQPVDEDVRMQTVNRAAPSATGGMQLWEREILNSQDVKRKATLAQLYFLDYYFDLLGYLAQRKGRLQVFKQDTTSRNISDEEYRREFRSYAGRERVLLRKRRTKLRVDQFRIIAQVGQGGYGSVYLARKADTGQVCALKKMKKTTLAKMDEVKHVLIERDILTATKTPWLVKLLYAFQDRDHVYLAMEYVPGGDFRTLLNNSGVLKEEHARFYAAEMFAGINELHKLGYIHRDLKPENFLVDGTGHVKLTDFGLATGALNPLKIESMKHKLDQVKDENLIFRSTLERRTIYKSMRMAEPRYADSVVGSPDYMPPEVLRGKTYTFSADYWSLGCILFEFLCGFPPFSGSTPEETWANLKNWQRVLRRPVYDKPEDLIFNLTDPAWYAVTRLIAHPKDRISTIQEVQALEFFQDIPFSSLRQIAAPFVPMLDGELDVGYFDSFSSPEDMAKYAEVFKKQQDVDAVAEKGHGDRKNWVGFTFGRNQNITPPAPTRKAEHEPLQTMF